MFCPNCGTRLPEEAKFCVNCGAPLNAVHTSPNPPVYEAPNPPVYEAPAAEEAPNPPVYEAPAAEEAPEPPVYEAPAVEEAPEPPVYEAPAAEEAPEPPVYEAPAVEEAPEPPVYEAPAAEEAPEPPVHEAPVAEEVPEPPVYEAPAAASYTAPMTAAYVPTVQGSQDRTQSYNQAPVRPGYSQPVPAPRPKTKKPVAPMVVTFVCLGLALIIFLLTAFVLFPFQKHGDESLTVYDLEGSWDLVMDIRAEDSSGAQVGIQLTADVEMTYDYGDYVVITMVPSTLVENGVAASSADLEGASATFYGRLKKGTLYFEYPSDDMYIMITVPLQRGAGRIDGQGTVRFDDNGYDGRLTCGLNRVF